MTPCTCRVCGRANDAHTHASPGVPRAPHNGDMTICAYCGSWSIFEGGGLRAPTPSEAAMIETDPDCQRAAQTLTRIQRHRNALFPEGNG
jgi:hypothetical protein